MAKRFEFRRNTVLAIVVLALVAIGAYEVFRNGKQVPDVAATQIRQIGDARLAENFQSALDQYAKVNSSADSTDNIKALAFLQTSGVKYRMTGNIQDFLADVAKEKQIANNASLPLQTRVLAINMVAGSFCWSGRNPVVFNALYTGPLFGNFLAPNDPNTSSLNTFNYSYSLLPTVKAAIFMSRGYALIALQHEKLGKSDVAEQVNKSKTLLQAADAMAVKNGTVEFDEGPHGLYLFWKAFTEAALGHFGVDNYKNQYRAAYSDYFKYSSQYPQLVHDDDLYAHFLYASFLAKDGDKEAAKAELKTLMDVYKSDTHPQSIPFRNFILNERQADQQYYTDALKIDRSVSPEFAAFVDSIK